MIFNHFKIILLPSLIAFILTITPIHSLFANDEWVMAVNEKSLLPLKFWTGATPGGLHVDFMKSIADDIGVDLKFEKETVEGGRIKFSQGLVQVDCCLSSNWFFDKNYDHVFSAPIYKYTDVLIFPEDRVYTVSDVTDLSSYSVAVIKGHRFLNDDQWGKRTEVETPKEMMRLLEMHEVDFAITGRHIAAYAMSHNHFNVVFGQPFSSFDVGVRLHNSEKGYLDKINASIAKFKKNGRFQEIIRKNMN